MPPSGDVPVEIHRLASKPEGPSEVADTQLLSRARQANQELFATLESFVCEERIQRFKGRLNRDGARQIDTVTAKVSFENGTEQYSNVRQDSRERPSIASISGAWSVGEFGTLLRQTQELLESGKSPAFQSDAKVEGVPAVLYETEVSEQDSPWDLLIRSQHFRIPFRADIWVSPETGLILKIERTSTSVPAEMGISEIRWSVTLQKVEMNQRTWLLPEKGEYEVRYQESGRREWNEMTFSDYHRYGSEVALRFQ